MKRWVIVTDRAMDLPDFRGQFPAAQVPGPDGYEAGDWLEVVVSENNPRIVWRIVCLDVALN